MNLLGKSRVQQLYDQAKKDAVADKERLVKNKLADVENSLVSIKTMIRREKGAKAPSAARLEHLRNRLYLEQRKLDGLLELTVDEILEKL
jgi:hypothetical protein